MCGILAIARSERTPDPAGFDLAMRRLHHRGPDASGIWRSRARGLTLAHTRLAIIDLTDAGSQPMTSADGDIAVTFNGEIYNAPALTRELRQLGCQFRSRSDTEVLVHGYQRWGIRGLLDRLLGMFAFALWDERTGQLHAAIDHAGQKPLYWSCQAGSLYLASDADALRHILPHAPKLDAEGLCHVLCHGYCPPPRTVWQDIQKLSPGTALMFVPGSPSPTIQTYWSPPDQLAEGAADPREDDRRFGDLWEQVVADHTLSDVPAGVFLSAGLDSSAVALALIRTSQPLECLTLALDSADDESPVAAETARALGLTHARIPFTESSLDETIRLAAHAFDEPQAYGAILTATAITRAARKYRKVIIAGDGGDETFAGYPWHRPTDAPATVNRATQPHRIHRAVADPTTDGATRAASLQALARTSYLHSHLQAVFPRFHTAEAAAIFAPLAPEYDEHTYASWCAEHDRPNLPAPRRAQRLDLMGFCAGSILPKIDRSSMAVGLELRAPFLDRRILEWSLSRPVDPAELSPATSKPTIRNYLRGRVPDAVLNRPKQGFSLRLGRDVWTERLPGLRTSRLVQSGCLHPQWESFVAPDAPYRSSRIFALCMLAAWAEHRL